MSRPCVLCAGDATFATTFRAISRSQSGDETEVNFRAQKGREFVVLLLGDVKKGQPNADIEKMLNELGFYRKEQGTEA